MRSCLKFAVPLVVLAAACAGSNHAEPGNAPSEAVIEIVLGLERDQPGLEQFALDVNDPVSVNYGGFLDVAEISSRFGASDNARTAVEEYFDGRVQSLVFDEAGGFAIVELTIDQATTAFDTGWNTGTTADGVTYVQPIGKPTLPSELDGDVVEVLSTTQELAPQTLTQAASQTGGEDLAACTQANMTVGRVHSLYGVSDLSAMALDGQGVTVSVISLGRFNPYSYSLWTSCLGLDSPVQPVETDVFVESGLPEETELDLDIDTIVAAAPHLDSLEAITVDEFGWVGRPFAAALNEEGVPPDVISSSIGFCEAQLDAQSVELAEYSLAALASVGTTVVTTSGDFGSAACQVDEPTTSVQYPASSAFVTAVGGTQLGSDGTDQVTWYGANRFASGGGTSTLVDRPDYQAEGDGRQVPDIAFLASPSDLPPIPTCTTEGCTWSATGGTSAAGPLFAGAIAQIKQLMRQQGRVPVGALNPLLYRFATEPDGYTDISVGSNDIYGLGCCTADIGFDLATGWGAPNIRAFADYAVNAAPMAP